jgi:hypothetical protein
MKRAVVLTGLVALACAGSAAAQAPKPLPTEAYATARSYAPGSTARIVLLGRTSGATLSVVHVGLERSNDLPTAGLEGVAVPATAAVSGGNATIRIGSWASGLYAARVRTRGQTVYAPFVVRPGRLGESRVAVVLPTNTWAAYNFRDANGDGVGDTWYADPHLSVELDRPFADHGVPPHFAQYDLLFLRWLARTGKQVDFLTDDDLERVSAPELSHAYDAIVFSGHHEYVTRHEYDVTEAYRNRGGNLMFLSANNFFYKVVRTGTTLHRVGRWRDLGRPEAALVGIQYLDWNHDRFANAPYVVRTNGWPFAGTGVHAGSRFGTYGIEIDSPTPDSPKNLRVLASVPDVFGRGRSAAMTYYTTPAGAKVFAAGTINFGGTAMWPPVRRILENVWSELATP